MRTPSTPRARRILAALAAAATALGATAVAAPAAAAEADVPSISGVLVGPRWLPTGGGTVVERVEYGGLDAGTHYGVFVELVDDDGEETGIDEVLSFTPAAETGTIDLELEVPAGFGGRTLHAVVSLYEPAARATPIAEQRDPSEPLQTLRVLGAPSMRGAIVAERWIPGEGWRFTERIDYVDLTPGSEYLISVIMRTPGGDYTEVGGESRITPAATSGSLDVEVTAAPGEAGRTLIATAWLFSGTQGGPPLAQVDDLADPGQTVVVRGVPSIRSSVADLADGDRILPAAGGTVVDTVSVEHLVPGAEYAVVGALVHGADGSTTPMTAATTFTATAGGGTVRLVYAVPAGYAGATLVSFPRLVEGAAPDGAAIAADEELDDPTQTVVVAAAALPATGAPAPVGVLGIGAVLLAVGATAALARPRRA